MGRELDEQFDKLQDGKVNSKEAFLSFLDALEKDYRINSREWDNTTIAEYIDAMKSWIEGFSTCEWNDIDWDSLDYTAMARILYMGKIYE